MLLTFSHWPSQTQKKIHSFSCDRVYWSGLFYSRAQGIYCGKKLLQRQEEKANVSRRNTNAFCLPSNTLVQFNNFIQRKIRSFQKAPSNQERKFIFRSTMQVRFTLYLFKLQDTIYCWLKDKTWVQILFYETNVDPLQLQWYQWSPLNLTR